MQITLFFSLNYLLYHKIFLSVYLLLTSTFFLSFLTFFNFPHIPLSFFFFLILTFHSFFHFSLLLHLSLHFLFPFPLLLPHVDLIPFHLSFFLLSFLLPFRFTFAFQFLLPTLTLSFHHHILFFSSNLIFPYLSPLLEVEQHINPKRLLTFDSFLRNCMIAIIVFTSTCSPCRVMESTEAFLARAV